MQGRHKDKRRLSLALAELILVSLAETHNTLFYVPTASSQVQLSRISTNCMPILSSFGHLNYHKRSPWN